MNGTRWIDHRQRLRTAIFRVSAAGIAILVAVSLVAIKPAVPDRIVLFTGPENSAYHDLGHRYAEDLRNRGLEVEVVVTEGALDNVRRIVEGSNAVAFAPAAMDWEDEAGVDISSIVAVGSVGFEPLWLFFRSDLSIVRVSDLSGKKVLTGGPGTVSHHVARKLLEKNGLIDQVQIQPALGQEKVDKLIELLAAKNIDAIFATGSPDSPLLRGLLHADGVQFMSFDRADAYSAQIPGISTLVAPEGVFDFARNVPQRDAKLLADTTCLIAHRKLHPAVAPMLLATVENTRHHTTELSKHVVFPSGAYVTLPLHSAARRYFSQGEVGLSKYLPYKVTRLVNHLGFLVLPLLTASVLLLKVCPVCLKMWSSFRIRRMFKRLETVEKRHAAGDDASILLAELDQIAQDSATMFVSISTCQDFVDLRQFVHDMRERVGTP